MISARGKSRVSFSFGQIEKIFLQYLAVYYNENMPNEWPNTKLTLVKLPKTFKNWPKWRKFAVWSHCF